MNKGKALQIKDIPAFGHFFKTALWSLQSQVITYHTDYRSADTAALCCRIYNNLRRNQNILNSGRYTQELKKEKKKPSSLRLWSERYKCKEIVN